jgi:hypothetical protein
MILVTDVIYIENLSMHGKIRLNSLLNNLLNMSEIYIIRQIRD